MEDKMNRRNFFGTLLGALLFPTIAYSAIKSGVSSLVEGTAPGSASMARAPKVMGVVGEWPMWQYGDYIAASHVLSAEDIIDYKSLCRDQARETFEALQVPDACDKIEYIIQQAQPDSEDPLLHRSTVAWKVTIPAPQWQWVLSEHPDKAGYLKYILKTRKRLVPISLNGNMQLIPRAQVRDYLRLMAI